MTPEARSLKPERRARVQTSSFETSNFKAFQTSDFTQSWSNRCHFLLARIEGDRMRVRAIGERLPAAAARGDIVRWTPPPDDHPVTGPIDIRLG